MSDQVNTEVVFLVSSEKNGSYMKPQAEGRPESHNEEI